MRNLKKILALVLALVMSMSLVVTANAFEDTADVDFKEAIDVLSGLKVFQGRTETEFAPEASITRAEVAAIIYRIVTGDVENKQVGIYADYNKFDDVLSTNWFAGYVNYCANATYVGGYGNGKFGPNDPVTGYQALAMILRAVGYGKNGEFSGTGWEVRTASVAKSLGITDNILDGTLGQPATRETVAEILFRAILVPTVTWNMAFGYQDTNTTLGYEAFKLEEICGVIVANEYADLNDGATLRTGKTEMLVDGKSYTLDYTSTLDDIGESRYAYVAGSKVLSLADTGINAEYETTDAADISTASKFESATGLRNGEEKHFINFEDAMQYEAQIRIQYWVDEDGDKNVQTAETGKFDLNEKLTEAEKEVLYNIFKDDDKMDGWVVIGTKELDESNDISDTMTWREFRDKYLVGDDKAVDVNFNENGNWLKVIDNDGDGYADYVLKVIYTMAQVSKIKDDVVTLDTKNETIADAVDGINELSTQAVVSADELAKGDIVYYAIIDGKAQTYKAEMVTAKIDKVNRNTLTVTTEDGAEYVESGIHEHIYADEYLSGVRSMAGKVSYDLFLDRGNYVAAFCKTNTTGNFTLLTDGWFANKKDADEYAVKAYIDGKQTLVDVTENGPLFIYDYNVDNNNWDSLRWLGASTDALNGDGVELTTTVVCLGDDGMLLPVDDASVSSRNTHRMVATDDNVIPGKDYVAASSYVTSARAGEAYNLVDSADVEIRALNSTVYYYVYPEVDGITVKEYVGYNNLPEETAEVEDVYAVGTETDRISTDANRADKYFTADVIVVEFAEPSVKAVEQVLVVDTPVVGAKVDIDEVEVIRANGEHETVLVDVDASTYHNYGVAGGKTLRPGLYNLRKTNTENIYVVEELDKDDIAGYRFAIGEIRTAKGTGADKYVEILTKRDTMGRAIETATYETYDLTDDSKLYTLGYAPEHADAGYQNQNASLKANDWDVVLDERVDESKTAYKTFSYTDERIGSDLKRYGNRNTVLVAYNAKDQVVYAVSFNNIDADMPGSNYKDYAQELYENIIPAKPDTTLTVEFYGINDAADGTVDRTINVTHAQAKAFVEKYGEDAILNVENAKNYVANEKIEFVTDAKTYTLNITLLDGSVVSYTLNKAIAGSGTGLTGWSRPIEVKDLSTDLVVAQYMANNIVPNAGVEVTSVTFYDHAGSIVATDEEPTALIVTAEYAVINTKAENGTTIPYVAIMSTANKGGILADHLNDIVAAVYDNNWTVNAVNSAINTVDSSITVVNRFKAYRQAGWTIEEHFETWGGSSADDTARDLKTAAVDTPEEIVEAYVNYIVANQAGNVSISADGTTLTKSGNKLVYGLKSAASDISIEYIEDVLTAVGANVSALKIDCMGSNGYGWEETPATWVSNNTWANVRGFVFSEPMTYDFTFSIPGFDYTLEIHVKGI